MKYNVPYGKADEVVWGDTPYINGDPSTATAGSIPPAASIELPQREIVNLIKDAGLVPTNSDLHQAAKGVQSGRLIYADDTGTVNAISLAVSPPVTALTKGMQFITIFAHDNTGPASASVSGLAFVEIVHPSDRTSLQPLDLRAGSIGCLAYDGTKFQLAWSQTPIGAKVYLTANLDYYVGGTGASDNNDGTLATLTAGTTHGPFATLQKAMNTIANFDLNGHNINVHVATPGNYAGVRLSRLSGSGSVIWTGDVPTPGNCVITGNGFSAILGQNCGPTHQFNGFALAAGGTFTNEPMCGINASGTGTNIALNDMEYNQCNGSHIAVTQGCVLSLGGKQIINGNAMGGNPQMTSGWHIYLGVNSIIQPNGGYLPVLSVLGALGGQNGGGFANVYALSFGELFYQSITGGANWTGLRYNLQGNAILNTHGGGPNYLPGSIAGQISTGGQYF